MTKITQFLLNKKIIPIIIVVLALIIGIFTYTKLNYSNSKTKYDTVKIYINYDCGTKKQLEQQFIIPFEIKLSQTSYIKKIKSIIKNQKAIVILDFDRKFNELIKSNIQNIFNELKNNSSFNSITYSIQESKSKIKPSVILAVLNKNRNTKNEIVNDYNYWQLRNIANHIKNNLIKNNYIKNVFLYSSPIRDIKINANIDKLISSDLTLSEIKKTINNDIQGKKYFGSIINSTNEFHIRMNNNFNSISGFKKLYNKKH